MSTLVSINNNSNEKTIRLKKGSIKVFNFTFNVDISSAQFFLGIKDEKEDSTYAISKQHSDFSVDVATKKVSVVIDTSSLEEGKNYIVELKTQWGSDSVDKTEDFYLYIEKAVTT